MRNMRNRTAHGYFDIDLYVVWENSTRMATGVSEAATCHAPGRQQ